MRLPTTGQAETLMTSHGDFFVCLLITSTSVSAITIAPVALVGVVLGPTQNRIRLGLMHNDCIRHRHAWAHPAFWIVCKHDLDPDSKNTLTHEHMTACGLDVMLLGLTRGNKVSVFEFHDLSTLCAQLSTDDHLATLCTVFHNKADNTVASAADR